MSEFVTRWPVDRLQHPDGSAFERVENLDDDGVRSALSEANVVLALVDLGRQTQWLDGDDRYAMWKSELRPHLVPPGAVVARGDMTDGFVYWASRWAEVSGLRSAIVFFKDH